MDFLNGDLLRAVNGIGVVTLCVLYIIGLIRGWHVLGRDCRSLVARLDKRIEIQDQIIAAQASQLETIAAVGETVTAVMRAIQELSRQQHEIRGGREQP